MPSPLSVLFYTAFLLSEALTLTRVHRARQLSSRVTQAKSRDESKRTTRPFTPKRAALRLGPPVTPTAAKTPTNSSADADADTANANGDGHPEGTAANGASGTPGAAGTGSGRRSSGGVRGRGSVQAPGSNGGVLTEAEAGKGVGAKGQQEEAEEPIVLDEIFRKTEAKPSLYWLPLSEEEVGAITWCRRVKRFTGDRSLLRSWTFFVVNGLFSRGGLVKRARDDCCAQEWLHHLHAVQKCRYQCLSEIRSRIWGRA